jgi:predicted Na+-dependent transporter
VLVLVSFTKYYRSKYDYKDVRSIFLWLIVVYAFLSFLLTGIYKHPIEQYLYILNIAAILFLLRGQKVIFDHVEESPRRWLIIFLIIICLLALLAAIAVSSHGPLKGSQMRFL